MAVSLESSVDHFATPPPPRPPYPPATPCAAVGSFGFRKEGEGNHRIKMETCERRDSRDHRDRTTDGGERCRKGWEAGRRAAGRRERLRDGQACCCRGDGGGGSPFLPSPLSRHLNLQRKQRGISLDGRAQEQSGPTTTGAGAAADGRGRQDGLTVGRADQASGNTSSLGHKRQDA